MKLSQRALAALFAVSVSLPAFAHHSFAMFDTEKDIMLKGTVKEFQWVNPHGWILMVVPNAEGHMEQWALEMGPPAQLRREGWLPETLKPGDQLTVMVHPLKDGTHGGQFQGAILSDGRTMGRNFGG